MLDVHPPHEPVHSWKSVFIHIAIIVVGLFIAVAIEQTVVFFHERHQRHLLEEQMREVFASDLTLDEDNYRQFSDLRGYFAAQRAAIAARLHREAASAAPPVDDPRMSIYFRFPSLAPYEAAKENGTVALLPTNRIRVYNRISYALQLAARVRDRYMESLEAIVAFHERYVDSRGIIQLRSVAPAPDLALLGPAELAEYLGLVANVIKYTDLFEARLRLFDGEAKAILGGAGDEAELMEAAIRAVTDPAHGTGTR